MAPKLFASSSSSSNRWIYDVFLSFRGEDTRRTFTDHLYYALEDQGITVFRDDNELQRGENITSELVRAIQGSRISVIVISRNYAASTWCLEELAEIMGCRKTHGQTVLPIFYDVGPSDVRNQKGSFEEAFAKHEVRFVPQTDKVARWRATLTAVANLSGWDLRNTADGHEGKFIKNIVQDILNVLNHVPLHEAIYPIGIDSRVQEIVPLLNIGLDDVRMLGICGMGGIGKTTIAKAIYNQLFYSFEGKSFLTSVRELSQNTNGKVQLQETLLSDILMRSDIKISSVDRGISVIKQRLSRKRVLVVLDDVDKLEQLSAIAESRDWFGSGSRIIITTRDRSLLEKATKTDWCLLEIYMVRELNRTESLKLFILHAFGKSHPTDDDLSLSEEAVDYCKGLPLALKVIGSFLLGRPIPDWKSALEKLRDIPDEEIQEKLKISFDSLRDDLQKHIFLDISCFFIGMDKDYVVAILNGCGFHAKIGLRELIERCLVTITESNKLMMHDLLRDMGREIVRKESCSEPGKRSRLWCHEEVINMLKNRTGTSAIAGVTLTLPEVNDMEIDTEAFVELKKLRLLQLHHVQLKGRYENFPRGLRWLCWHGFQLELVPNDFYMGNLVAVDLRYSKLRTLWKDSGVLEKLKFLNLSHSHYLRQTFEFSKLPNLEELRLKDCRRLVELHHSIGSLERLRLVNLKDCKNLKSLPWSCSKLKSLKTLILSGCCKLEKLPEDLGELKSLETLTAENTAIRQVPKSIVQLTNLTELSLCGYKGSPSNSLFSRLWSWMLPRRGSNAIKFPLASFQGFRHLKTLRLNYCNFSDDAFPGSFGSLSCLSQLDLGGSSFVNLPSVSSLSNLHFLVLNNCTELQSIADLPANLYLLDARNCTSLERLPDKFDSSCLSLVSFANCHKILEAQKLDIISGYNGMMFLMDMLKDRIRTSKKDTEEALSIRTSNKDTEEILLLNAVRNAEWMSLVTGSETAAIGGIFFPGKKIPDHFTCRNLGSTIDFIVPRIHGNFLGLEVCFLCSCGQVPIGEYVPPIMTFLNCSKDEWKSIVLALFDETPQGDHIWKGIISKGIVDLGSGDRVHIAIAFLNQISVDEIGVHLLLGENSYVDFYDNVEEADNDEAGVSSQRGLDQYDAEPRFHGKQQDRVTEAVVDVLPPGNEIPDWYANREEGPSITLGLPQFESDLINLNYSNKGDNEEITKDEVGINAKSELDKGDTAEPRYDEELPAKRMRLK